MKEIVLRNKCQIRLQCPSSWICLYKYSFIIPWSSAVTVSAAVNPFSDPVGAKPASTNLEHDRNGGKVHNKKNKNKMDLCGMHL